MKGKKPAPKPRFIFADGRCVVVVQTVETPDAIFLEVEQRGPVSGEQAFEWCKSVLRNFADDPRSVYAVMMDTGKVAKIWDSETADVVKSP